jgi:hypothetical protein
LGARLFTRQLPRLHLGADSLPLSEELRAECLLCRRGVRHHVRTRTHRTCAHRARTERSGTHQAAGRRASELARAEFPRTNLVPSELPGPDLAAADLTAADLATTNLAATNLAATELAAAKLAAAKLAAAHLPAATLANGGHAAAIPLAPTELDKLPALNTPCFQLDEPVDGGEVAGLQGSLRLIPLLLGPLREGWCYGRSGQHGQSQELDGAHVRLRKVRQG